MSNHIRANGNSGLHVAILPDGNGRWAAARGLPRTEGHRAGVAAVRRVVAAAPALGIGTLDGVRFFGEQLGAARQRSEEPAGGA